MSRILFIASYIPNATNADVVNLSKMAINYRFSNSDYDIDMLRSIVVRFSIVGVKAGLLNDNQFQSVQYSLISRLFEFDKSPIWASFLVSYNSSKGIQTSEPVLRACLSGADSSDQNLRQAARFCQDLTTRKEEIRRSENTSSKRGQTLFDWIKENKGLTALAIGFGAIYGLAGYCKEKGGCLKSSSSSVSGSSRDSSVARAEAAVKVGGGSCYPQGFTQLSAERNENARWKVQCSNGEAYTVVQESDSSWKFKKFLMDTTLGRALSGFKEMKDVVNYVCNYDCKN